MARTPKDKLKYVEQYSADRFRQFALGHVKSTMQSLRFLYEGYAGYSLPSGLFDDLEEEAERACHDINCAQIRFNPAAKNAQLIEYRAVVAKADPTFQTFLAATLKTQRRGRTMKSTRKVIRASTKRAR